MGKGRNSGRATTWRVTQRTEQSNSAAQHPPAPEAADTPRPATVSTPRGSNRVPPTRDLGWVTPRSDTSRATPQQSLRGTTVVPSPLLPPLFPQARPPPTLRSRHACAMAWQAPVAVPPSAPLTHTGNARAQVGGKQWRWPHEVQGVGAPPSVASTVSRAAQPRPPATTLSGQIGRAHV